MARKPLTEAEKFIRDSMIAEAEKMRVDPDQVNRPTDQMLAKTQYGVSERVEISAAGRKRKRNKKTGRNEGNGVPAVKSHRIKSTIDVYGHYIRQEDQDALMRFLYDSELAMTVNLTVGYEGASGGGFGPRSGGVPDRLRLAHNRWAFIKSQLDDRSLDLLSHLVLASRFSESRPMTVVEIAQSHAPHLKSRQSMVCFGMGLLVATAWTVKDLYEIWDKDTRPNTRTNRQNDTRLIQGRRERQAKADGY